MGSDGVEEEGVFVGLGFDDFGGGFAGSVAGFGFDAHEDWGGAGLGVLEGGAVFEAVGGEDAVVVVGGFDEYVGVRGVGAEVVEGAVGAEGFEVFGFVWAAVFVLPGPADGELVEAEHVQDANGGCGGGEEVGALVGDGGDEESAVAAAFDDEF